MQRHSSTLLSLLVALCLIALIPRSASAQDVDDALADIEDRLAKIEEAFAGDKPITAYQTSYECRKNQRMVIDGGAFAEGIKIGDKKTKLVIDAHGNCHMLLRNLEIVGVVAIEAHGNANVIIRDSKITGKTALYAHGNANVRVRNSTLKGTSHGVKLRGNASVAVDAKTKITGRIKKGRRTRFVKVK